mgnify:CR=1 FL=1
MTRQSAHHELARSLADLEARREERLCVAVLVLVIVVELVWCVAVFAAARHLLKG